MTENKFYKKYRDIEHSEIAHATPCTRELWDYILRNAYYADSGPIQRGTFPITVKQICEDLHWKEGFIKKTYSPKQVRTALGWLRDRRMVETWEVTHRMIVSVCNYDKWNAGGNKGGNSGGKKAGPVVGTMVGEAIDKKKEERRKKKNKEGFDPLKIDFPPELGTGDFARAWIDWCAHRSEIKQKLTEKSVQMQIKKLSAHGPDVACKMIEQSIMNGWTGLFDLKGDGSQNAGPSISDAQRQEQKRLDAVEEERIRRQQEMVDRKLGRVSQ